MNAGCTRKLVVRTSCLIHSNATGVTEQRVLSVELHVSNRLELSNEPSVEPTKITPGSVNSTDEHAQVS